MLATPDAVHEGAYGKIVFPLVMMIGSLLSLTALVANKPIMVLITALLLSFPVGIYFVGGNAWQYIGLAISYFCLIIVALAMRLALLNRVV